MTVSGLKLVNMEYIGCFSGLRLGLLVKKPFVQGRMSMTTNKNEKFNAVTQMDENACTVFLSGEMDLSVAPDFRLVMEPLVGNADQNLIVNMKDLKYIDSTGIGILLSILKARHSMNAGFAVEEVPPQIQRLFEMTGIAKFFAPQENSH